MKIDNTDKSTPELKRRSFLKSKAGITSMAIFVAIIISIVGYSLFVGPQLDRVGIGKEFDVASLDAELKAKEEQLSKLKSVQATLEGLPAEDVNKVANMVPSEPSVPELLAQLEAIANASGVVLSSVNVAEVEERTTNTRQQLQAQLNQPGQAQASSEKKTLSVRVSISTLNYDAFRRFVEALEEHIRIIDTQRFTFSSENQLHTLTFDTYYLPN